jgi:hypothetical protein
VTQAETVIQAWLDVAAANRGTERFRVSLAAFNTLLDGEAPSIDDIARMTDLAPDDTRQIVSSLHEAGRLTLDAAGQMITGAGGLSVVESRHILEMRGRRYWVWCAMDAVGIPAALGEDAGIASATADTGEAVRITIEQGRLQHASPADLVISLVSPSLDRSLHGTCCSRIGFYRDAQAVSADAAALTIPETMSLGARLWCDGVPL